MSKQEDFLARIQAMVAKQNAENSVKQEAIAAEIQAEAISKDELPTTEVGSGESITPAGEVDAEELFDKLNNGEAIIDVFSPVCEEVLHGSTPTEDQFLQSLPQLDITKHEFLVPLEHVGSTLYCAVRELYWWEALDIEARSFRTNSHSEEYFAGEYERRETLRKAILWVAAVPDCKIDHNTDGTILSRLHQEVVEPLWAVYHQMVTLGADEAAALYNSAVAYFRGEAVRGIPVPPMIIEVDMMLSFGGMNRQELRDITCSDLERLQLIRSARADALGINSAAAPVQQVAAQSVVTEREDIDEEIDNLPPHMFPPGVNPRAMRKLHNKAKK